MTWRNPRTGAFHDAAELALDAIVARLDGARGYQPFFKVELGPPARALHDSWDYVDMAGRYVEAMVAARRVFGLSVPEEAPLRAFFLANQNPRDGLFYNQEGPNSSYCADMFCQSRALLALATMYEDAGDSDILERWGRLVAGLIDIAERRADYAYYPRNLYRGGEWLEGGLFYTPKDLWTVRPGYGGTQLEGIMRYAAVTGDESALAFVGDYLRYFLQAARVVAEDGSYTGHLHSQGIVPTMIGAAVYAESVGDRDMLELCGRFLRFTLSQCSSFGWVPDGIGGATCETCALADVIHLIILLTRLGVGDWWPEIGRFARNQLLANQFRDPDRVLVDLNPEPNVAAMVRGSFASWALPNDLLGGPDIEGCCTGSGLLALCRVMEATPDSGGMELDSAGLAQNEAVEVEEIAGAAYEVTWSGGQVVALAPPGAGYPPYG